MTWLGYTVTYRSGESSDNVRWINYNDWQSVNGLQLPKAITWYKHEGDTILEPASNVSFEEVTLSEQVKPASFYSKPDEGQYVDVKLN